MPKLTTDNTNALAHRVAGDSLVFECQHCEYGEVPITGLIESDSAACLDCETRYELRAEVVE